MYVIPAEPVQVSPDPQASTFTRKHAPQLILLYLDVALDSLCYVHNEYFREVSSISVDYCMRLPAICLTRETQSMKSPLSTGCIFTILWWRVRLMPICFSFIIVWGFLIALLGHMFVKKRSPSSLVLIYLMLCKLGLAFRFLSSYYGGSPLSNIWAKPVFTCLIFSGYIIAKLRIFCCDLTKLWSIPSLSPSFYDSLSPSFTHIETRTKLMKLLPRLILFLFCGGNWQVCDGLVLFVLDVHVTHISVHQEVLVLACFSVGM